MQDIPSQGFYVCLITKHSPEYSFILLYLSEEENEDFDQCKLLHASSKISWLGHNKRIKRQLNQNGNQVNITVDKLYQTHQELMARNYIFLNLIAETDAKNYMLQTVYDFILQLVSSCKS